MTCPLCKNKNISHFYKSAKPFIVDYFKCQEYFLIFMDQKSVLSKSEEKKRYSNHENDIKNSGYVSFLSKLTDPMEEYISKDMKGLDFGCGPGPVLSKMMSANGYDMDNYDPYFFPNDLAIKYDFITSSEVVEHFNDPYKSFFNILKLLNKGGILGIMTSVKYDSIDFEKWYYRHDETHISFYTPETLYWIEEQFNLKRLFFKGNVIIWQKS